MDDMWMRFATQMAARVSGPMKFRLVLQPAHGVVLRNPRRAGGCQVGQAAVLLGPCVGLADRVGMLEGGWKDVGKVFILAIVLDVMYQLIVFRFVYPGEALVVAVILAILPYLILRGLVTRMFRKPK